MGKIHRWGMLIAFVVIIVCAYIGVRTVFIEDKNTTVPSMIGMQLVDAVEALQREGLLAKVDQVDSPERADTVISQSFPEGEKVSRGKVIILRVSKGGAVMPMPDVRGLKFEEGVKRLSDAGLKVGNVLRVTDKLKPAGSIIAQNPAAPQQVAANCMVRLLVSSGSTGNNEFIALPDLRGQTEEVARQILEQIGLRVGIVVQAPSSAVPAGTVLSTVPRNGANVPAGTEIKLTFARTPNAGEETAELPPTNDQDPKKAEAVRTVVIKDTEPSQIPSKIPDKKETPKPVEAKPAETPKQPEVKPAEVKPVQTPPANTASSAQKTAKLRYQVPPLTKPLSLKIDITDTAGTRIIKNIAVNGSEYISMNVPYSGAATITIHLGGDFVWQDRYN